MVNKAVNCGVNSHMFKDNISSNLQELFVENYFADVTLVSDEQVAFHAHKFVLSAQSSVLKDLFISNPNPHPIIYLRGIQEEELKIILQFMYLGKAICSKSLEKRIYRIAKDLELKQLQTTLSEKHNEASKENATDHDAQGKGDKHLKLTRSISIGPQNKYIVGETEICKVDDSNETNTMATTKNKRDDYEQSNTFLRESIDSNFQSTADKLYKCTKCEAVFRAKGSLLNHIRIKHEGVRYYCDICTYKATTKQDVTRHKEAIHEGIRYSCDDCGYLAKHLMQLKMHKSALHGSVKFYCDQCEYSTGWRSHLKRHERRKHISNMTALK